MRRKGFAEIPARGASKWVFLTRVPRFTADGFSTLFSSFATSVPICSNRLFVYKGQERTGIYLSVLSTPLRVDCRANRAAGLAPGPTCDGVEDTPSGCALRTRRLREAKRCVSDGIDRSGYQEPTTT